MTRGSQRLVLAVAVAAACLAAAALWRLQPASSPRGGPAGADRRGADPPTAVATVRSGPARVPRAVRVLHAWDRRRAAAYHAGHPHALRRLYVARSPAGRADVRVLRGYLARGDRVTALRMQLLRVAVVSAGRRRLVLRVTDRLAVLRVTHHRRPLTLPTDRASRHRIVLVRHGRWRVAAVT